MPGVIFEGEEPADTDESDATAYTIGLEVQPQQDDTVRSVWWRVPDTLPTGSVTAGFWAVGGGNPLLGSKTLTPGAPGWTQFTFDDPIAVLDGGDYVAGVLTQDRYVFTSGRFGGGPVVNNSWQATTGRLNVGGTLTYPGGGTGLWFGIDVGTASVVTATGAANLGALTGTATGRRIVHATGSASLGALTAAATGTRRVHATAAATLGGLTAAATAQRTVNAAAAANLGALAASAAADRTVHATAVANLGALTGQIVIADEAEVLGDPIVTAYRPRRLTTSLRADREQT